MTTDLSPGADGQGGAAAFSRPLAYAIGAVAIVTAAVHLYYNSIGLISELSFAALHFGSFGLMCALIYPARKGRSRGAMALAIDAALGLIALFCGVYFLFSEDAYWARGGHMSGLDMAVALASILLALEFLRRTMGIFIPILILFALSYAAFWGQHISGVFRFPGISVEELIARAYFVNLGLFGDIAQISMTYVFMFVLFGSFLVKSGASDFIIDLSRALARRTIGGAGIVAVLGSAMMGSISGSAVANIVTTGVVTIPLMKRSGYKATFAAAVETAASTGGPLLPPIMGAGAFVMASYTQISYLTITAMAVLPALLYFLSVIYLIRMQALKDGQTPFVDEEARSIGQVLREGGLTLAPLIILIALLVVGYTATYAAAGAILATVVFSWLTPNKMGPAAIAEAVIDGVKNATPTAILLISIGLLVGVLGTTGFGPTFSLMIIQWSGGSLIVMLLLVTLVSLLLGMGLPVTAAYIVLATISAPSLADLITTSNMVTALTSGQVPETVTMMLSLVDPGIAERLAAGLSEVEAYRLLAEMPVELRAALRPEILSTEVMTASLLAAHMIIFWVSQDSNVTPPVCLPAFVAAAIAKSPPMATGFAAFRLCKALYIIPLLFAFTPLLSGDWAQMLMVFVPAMFGLHALSAAMSGMLETRLGVIGRFAAAGFGALLLWPIAPGIKAAALLVYVVWVAFDWRQRRVTAKDPTLKESAASL
ncbi:TRAP transporter permease [Puniceibacterium sediminis]|uniref:TRAP transporter, 4TM/12TM fusion protein n=1 Tax=Puniceibacterium sediminis TaxID=1608407 RepID=A0A238X6S4_9RHOB|nr:TRAP transporter fused permease subunit [Puniceibacterium sediminis]SNR54332.1 TRAP transporter, 4TM/12TM fusion protein [Puniceibacterium sediminis]